MAIGTGISSVVKTEHIVAMEVRRMEHWVEQEVDDSAGFLREAEEVAADATKALVSCSFMVGTVMPSVVGALEVCKQITSEFSNLLSLNFVGAAVDLVWVNFLGKDHFRRLLGKSGNGNGNGDHTEENGIKADHSLTSIFECIHSQRHAFFHGMIVIERWTKNVEFVMKRAAKWTKKMKLTHDVASKKPNGNASNRKIRGFSLRMMPSLYKHLKKPKQPKEGPLDPTSSTVANTLVNQSESTSCDENEEHEIAAKSTTKSSLNATSKQTEEEEEATADDLSSTVASTTGPTNESSSEIPPVPTPPPPPPPPLDQKEKDTIVSTSPLPLTTKSSTKTASQQLVAVLERDAKVWATDCAHAMAFLGKNVEAVALLAVDVEILQTEWLDALRALGHVQSIFPAVHQSLDELDALKDGVRRTCEALTLNPLSIACCLAKTTEDVVRSTNDWAAIDHLVMEMGRILESVATLSAFVTAALGLIENCRTLVASFRSLTSEEKKKS